LQHGGAFSGAQWSIFVLLVALIGAFWWVLTTLWHLQDRGGTRGPGTRQVAGASLVAAGSMQRGACRDAGFCGGHSESLGPKARDFSLVFPFQENHFTTAAGAHGYLCL
jgi:hypothetical protein